MGGCGYVRCVCVRCGCVGGVGVYCVSVWVCGEM